MHVQSPVARSQAPALEHSWRLCAVFAADALSAQALPVGQFFAEQSAAKVHSESHVHALPAPHDPWPLQLLGHCATTPPRSRQRHAAILTGGGMEKCEPSQICILSCCKDPVLSVSSWPKPRASWWLNSQDPKSPVGSALSRSNKKAVGLQEVLFVGRRVDASRANTAVVG